MTAELDRQTRILDAAERRFLADGFERCSVESIANEARVSKREIYRDWKSKADLFIAVTGRLFASNDVDLSAIHQRGEEMRSVLGFLARHLLDQFVTDRNRDIFRASIAAIRDFPEVAYDIHHRRLTAWTEFGSYFQELIATEKIQVANASAAANRFGSLCVKGGRYLFGYAAPEEPARVIHASRMVDLFLNGYQPALANQLSIRAKPSARPSHGHVAQLQERAPVEIRMSPEKQSLISEALLNEFLGKGYHRANIAQVAKAVHVSKSSIYRQYNNKALAFEELIKLRIQKLDDVEAFAPIRGETLYRAIVRLCRAILDRHLASENIAIIRVLMEESRIFPHLGQFYYDGRLQLTGRHLRALLHQHQLTAPDDDVIEAFHVLATYGTRFIAFPTLPEEDERTALSEEAAMIFLCGVAGDRQAGEERELVGRAAPHPAEAH